MDRCPIGAGLWDLDLPGYAGALLMDDFNK
jgi:hypothetical protein